MGMGEHDGVQVLNRQLERVPVVQTQLLIALEQAAIDQDMQVSMLQQVFTAGDRACGAQECHTHGSFLEPSGGNAIHAGFGRRGC
jgi:hypothetical protein